MSIDALEWRCKEDGAILKLSYRAKYGAQPWSGTVHIKGESASALGATLHEVATKLLCRLNERESKKENAG